MLFHHPFRNFSDNTGNTLITAFAVFVVSIISDVNAVGQSAAYFWLNDFHFDGLRMDAVRNLIYWQGNSECDENKTTIEFIQKMNSGLKKRLPDIMLIADAPSAYSGVTNPVSEGGLGFDFKWDLGWMNDTLDYFRLHPSDRTPCYHKLTFSMMYFYNKSTYCPFPTMRLLTERQLSCRK